MSEENKSRITVWFATILFGAAFGYFYTELAYGDVEGGAQAPLWMSTGIGMTIAGTVSFFEIWLVNHPDAAIRKLPFIPRLLIRTAVGSVLILGSILLFQSMADRFAGTQFLSQPDEIDSYVTDYVVSVIICALVIFYLQMRLFIGPRNLTNLILGKYFQPNVEERIFMFCDVAESSKSAVRLGDIGFHKYLNDLFVRFDGPITRNGGAVHSYVGDAVIATWPLTNSKKKNTRVIKALFDILALLEKDREELEEKYGAQTKVRFAIHGGPVVTGETGYSKRQITYLGDTVNITARLENAAKEIGVNNVISTRLISLVSIPPNIQIDDLGARALKGIDEPVEISSLRIHEKLLPASL